MSERSLIRKIDGFLFDQVSSIRALPPYSTFQESLASLNDEVKDIVKYAISFAIIFIPVLITLIFWGKNLSDRDKLEAYKTIYVEANIQQEKVLTQASKKLIDSKPATAESDLTNIVGGLLSSARINIQNIRVQNFNSQNFSDSLTEYTADIIFNDLTTEQLGRMVTAFIHRKKMKINNVEIVRNDSKKLLEGKIAIVYLNLAQGE